jgi:hypothetical protein
MDEGVLKFALGKSFYNLDMRLECSLLLSPAPREKQSYPEAFSFPFLYSKSESCLEEYISSFEME